MPTKVKGERPARIQVTTIGTRDLNEQFSQNPISFYRNAYDNGMNLSTWLNTVSPRESQNDLDAFDRLLAENDIRVKSNPRAGWWASRASDFMETPATRALYLEYFARQWRGVSYAGRMPAVHTRDTYLDLEAPPGSWERPYQDAQQASWDQQVAPAIPLSELVAVTTPISGDAYRAFYLTYDATEVRMFRTGESTDLPTAKLVDSERTIILRKYGRQLEASYEQMRRMRVDKLAMQIQLIAVQSEVDKVAAGLDIIINGDGNAGTAATNHDLTVLDTAATAGTLTATGWINFKMQFANPYVLTTALMQTAVALQLQLLTLGNANTPLTTLSAQSLIGSIRPINRTADNVGFGWTSDAPALTIVGFDNRMALEEVTEIGSTLVETERFIGNQTEVIAMSEVSGFAVMDPTASRTLDVNA